MNDKIAAVIAGILIVSLTQLTGIQHRLKVSNDNQTVLVETVATVVGRVNSVNDNISVTGFLVNDGGVLRIAPYDPGSRAALSRSHMPTHILITKTSSGKVTSWQTMSVEVLK